jgi:hypothetical protein
MADDPDGKANQVANAKKAQQTRQILPRGVLHSTVSGVELNDDQKQAIKDASGVDVDWLLLTQTGHAAARDVDTNALGLTRLTWCW